jgi:hypothetical protein
MSVGGSPDLGESSTRLEKVKYSCHGGGKHCRSRGGGRKHIKWLLIPNTR